MTTTTEIEVFQFQNVPSTEEGGLIVQADVRVVQIDGEPWFVAKDVTSILGFSNGRDALSKHVLPAQKGVSRIATPSGDQGMTVISEAGLYRLIMRSNVPAAAPFQDWVTAVVLPTIRKTGGYVDPTQDLYQKIAAGDTAAMLEGFKASIKAAEEAQAKLLVAEAEKIAAQAALEEAEPHAKLGKRVVDELDGELFSLRDAARKLGVPPLTFNDILREWNWIDKDSTAAKAYAVSSGFAENRIYVHPGSGAGTTQGRLTNKGLERAAIKLEQQGVWRGYEK
ncbi:hypothetical protein ODIN_74 [Mycobacterium phage Odin]|nr:hypothetical protein ODIN_74 [Mycobacterium phage Odin]